MAALLAFRASKPFQSAASIAWFMLPSKSPESYCMMTGVWCGKDFTKFCRRSSAGSLPISRAAVSIIRSTRYEASGRPAPRYASTGTVLV